MPFQSKVANVEKKEIARIEMSPEFPVSPVDYNVRSETPPIPPHIHDCLELGWCHRGSGVFLVDNKILKFKQGDAVFINSREVHIMYSTPGGETAWSFINLNQEELLSAFVTGQERWSDVSGYCGPGFHNIIDGECHPELTRVIREIIECRNREESDYRSEVRALVWLLLIRLRRWMLSPEERSFSPRKNAESLHHGFLSPGCSRHPDKLLRMSRIQQAGNTKLPESAPASTQTSQA